MFTGAGVGLLATDYNQCVFHAALWRGAVSAVVLLMREGFLLVRRARREKSGTCNGRMVEESWGD